MSTTEQILNTHELRAQNAIVRLSEEFNTGNLSLESDILERVTQEYISLFNSLGKPRITPREMNKGDLLRLSSILYPLVELDEDLDIGYSQVDNIRSSIKNISNLCAIEREALGEQLSEVQTKTKLFQLWTPDTNEDIQWSGDTFNNTARIDEASSTAWHNAQLGAVSLKPISSIDLNNVISNVKVYPTFTDSTHPEGMPGNTLEIAGTGYKDNPDLGAEPTNPIMMGDTYKDSSNPKNIVDNDSTTWFEWEKYMLPATQRLSLVGYALVPGGTTIYRIIGEDAFSTDSGGSPEHLDLANSTNNYGWRAYFQWPNSADQDQIPYWVVHPWAKTDTPPNENNKLTLTFSIELASQQDINWISLTPYMAGITGATVDWELLESVTAIYGDEDKSKELLTQSLKLNSNIQIPIDKDSGIPVKNVAGVAVIPCNVENVKRLIFKVSQPHYYETKIAHAFYIKETKYESTFWRGLSKCHRSSISYTRVANPINNDPIRNNVKGLLGLGGNETWTDLSITKYYDIFKAYRYCIGIRDITLSQREYESTGMIQSIAHYFEKEVSAVSLITGEIIPEDWPQSNWISYQISHDNQTWKNIVPQKSDIDNSMVEFPATKTVYLRAYLTRPANRPNETPCLTYYAIKAIPVVE